MTDERAAWVPVTADTSPRAVIFDLDGVITDTAEQHYRAWQRLADEQGWDFDRTVNERLRGVSRIDSLDLVLAGRPASTAQRMEWAGRKNAYYLAALADLSPSDILPGARELVAECRRRGLATAIGSSSRNARTVLARLAITELFDVISDGNSVEAAKPAPALFLHAAEGLGVDAARCIVVEDAASGVDAALAAGMLAVGVGPARRVGHAPLRFDDVASVSLDEILRHAMGGKG